MAIAPFHAKGLITTDLPPDGDWPVAANARIQQVRATVAVECDVDLTIGLYLIARGADDMTLLETFTLAAMVRQDAWGISHRVRTGDRFTIGLTLGGSPSTGSGLLVHVLYGR